MESLDEIFSEDDERRKMGKLLRAVTIMITNIVALGEMCYRVFGILTEPEEDEHIKYIIRYTKNVNTVSSIIISYLLRNIQKYGTDTAK